MCKELKVKNLERIHWIDVAKGICIISVIIGHFGNETANNIVYAFHLTVFFILSGYTLNKKKLDRYYINQKFSRLMIPYFLTCFFCMMMKLINSIFLYRDARITTLTGILSKELGYDFFASGTITNFSSIEWGGRIGAIWFLPALFFGIIIVQYLIQKIPNEKIIILISVSLALIAFILAKFIWLPFSILSALFSTPFIVVGHLCKQYDILDKLKIPYLIFSLFIFIFGYLLDITKVYFVSATADSLFFSLFISLFTSICLMYICKIINHNKILEFYGRNSLIILCVHLFDLNTIGAWYKKYLPISIMNNFWFYFLIRFIVITLISLLIVTIFPIIKQYFIDKDGEKKIINNGRDEKIDICKAILIVLMLIGHWSIDDSLRSLIYSFHMLAFVIFSGYFFKPSTSDNLFLSLRKLIKSLIIPYLTFSFVFIFTAKGNLLDNLKTALMGISFTKNFFTDIPSIGPMYFVLLLFLIRLGYLLIMRFIKRTSYQYLTILLCYVFGMIFAYYGMWLPWSADCALVCIMFYHFGYLLRKYNVLEIILNNQYIYFILSSVFAAYVYLGSMELAIRNYNDLFVMSFGVISGTLLIYLLSSFISNFLQYRYLDNIKELIITIGRNTIYILAFHTLFNSTINQVISNFFDLKYIYSFIISISIQVLIGTFLGYIVNKINTMCKLI